MITIDIVERYKASLKDDLLKETVKAYVYDIGHFLAYLKGKDLVEVTSRDIKNYLLTTGGGNRIENRRLASLSSLFNFLIEDEKILDNPVSGVKRRKVRPGKPAFLKPFEFDIVLSFCPDTLSRIIVLVFFYTGIRLEELRTCPLSSLDIEKRELKVKAKGGGDRYVPFPRGLLPLLNEYLGKRNSDSEFLFVSENGKQLTRHWIEYHLFTRLSKESKVFVRPHKLRHSFATNCIERGMSRECLKEILGHKQISTTDWYIHITPKVKEEYDKAYDQISMEG